MFSYEMIGFSLSSTPIVKSNVIDIFENTYPYTRTRNMNPTLLKVFYGCFNGLFLWFPAARFSPYILVSFPQHVEITSALGLVCTKPRSVLIYICL